MEHDYMRCSAEADQYMRLRAGRSSKFQLHEVFYVQKWTREELWEDWIYKSQRLKVLDSIPCDIYYIFLFWEILCKVLKIITWNIYQWAYGNMTTAARPTFEPARGGRGKGEGDLSALSKQYSSRDLPSHNKLKRRFVAIKVTYFVVWERHLHWFVPYPGL